MATVNWYCNKDTRVARRTSDSWDAGAGACDYLPVGYYSGYRYRAYLGFSYSFSGMTSISSAIMHVKTTGQNYVAFGSDPDIKPYRITTSSWAEGTAVSLSSSNATVYGDITSVDDGDAAADISPAENTWDTINVTNIVQAAFAAGVFRGIELRAVDDGADEVTEFYAREYGSNDIYITVTYSTNSVPNAPTLNSGCPANGSRVAGTDFTLDATHSDPDSDALLNYEMQVSTDGTFASVTHANWTAVTTGIVGNEIDTTYEAIRAAKGTGTALSRGVVYYWRVRTSSSAGTAGYGTWSTARSFTTNALRVTSLSEPSGSSRLGKLSYTAAAGWASPRLNITWSSTDGNGDAQTKYQVFIKNDADGTTFYDSGEVASSAVSLVVPATFVEGNKYRVKVRTFDGYEWGDYSTEYTIRVRWGVGVYRSNLGSVPTSLQLTTLSTTSGSSSAVVMEYSSNTSTTTPTTWYNSVGSVPLQQYFFYKVWLLAWGASPATSPSLDQLVITWSGASVTADKWSYSTGWAVDVGTKVYGTQSMRGTADGTNYTVCSQDVAILPDTWYVLSAYMKGEGLSWGHIKAIVGAQSYFGNWDLTSAANVDDFTRVSTAPWYSGSATTATIQTVVGGPSSTNGKRAWFDAVKLEASKVVTPWQPGYVSGSVAIDAGGLQVDANAGGIFRLRGSTGGSRDIVDLGATGLIFGGDAQLSSPSAGKLLIKHTNGTSDALLDLDSSSGAGVVTVMGAGGQPRIGTRWSTDSYNRVELNANYDGIRWGPGNAALDVELYRATGPVLKTDDAFQAASLAIGTNKVARFVAIDGYITVVSGTYSSSDANPVTSGELTGLPSTGVVAVLGHVMVKADGGTAGSLRMLHYVTTTIGGGYGCGAYTGGLSGTSYGTDTGIVTTGGTNNRQVKYSRQIGSAGTYTYEVRVLGYWTTE